MTEIDFLAPLHKATTRDYVQRVVEYDKAECAAVAKQWGYDYWDGDRRFGYGGMRYDGRWRPVAEAMVAHYGLKAGMRVLDIGCGKAFLLHELTQVVPGIEVVGLDISVYAIEHAKEEVRPFLVQGDCSCRLPWPDRHFDFVLSINTFHNLINFQLMAALKEMVRVARGPKWLCVESWRNEREKANLLYWQLTCHSFYTPEEWRWFYDLAGYDGDHGFIYFE
ncbi:putative S-adenosyl-L-methionine (SAM)-dependent methyltransferase [Magnetospirillum sp. XM-1]|uniref:class I SAM-dependent methyltransferase n=1 Tax=Magnetospirillum sp. XM-1 TaxID=1663591 RepID=UPI00073E02B0|nr:class I SAM-dependent methyltransferase [Magnetospirillum sp. XM-1]CUW37971.1 putative S-adenosyl-L-methionine (SAM)-dependent methyltransferase [Magnetospirillum sp. XM-1]